MKKTILYLAIIILASFFLATCEKQQKKYTIGVSQLVRDPWRDKFGVSGFFRLVAMDNYE